MRVCFVPLLLITAVAPLCLSGQRSDSDATRRSDSAELIGVWRGEFDHLPGVDLVITDEGGELHGAILFYLHRRPDVNSSYTSTPGLPEPMFNVVANGRTLRFEVSHRRAHPPRSLHDEPMRFRLRLTGPGQAELMNESEGSPVLEMKHSEY